MKVGTITTPNSKGQIVIPKKIRDSLGINPHTPINIITNKNSIILHPISEFLPKTDNQAFLKVLKKTQGAWANDDWPETEKRQRDIELAAAKKAKNVW